VSREAPFTKVQAISMGSRVLRCTYRSSVPHFQV
jgi:hypothetical protein